ncbi:type ISP restriction/modification enzyme [Candidatus Parabeggiatoa sp. HSG14]|uniref:type ISP restriction/modification enzyme n=1 Tax=Candidatus Parabeggiatoa sp. HSG14 TaxID=3055593 RepID=UPI0025A6D668|nr:N-6 DNA methylase [Thiotrichales bacterium HSG14]
MPRLNLKSTHKVVKNFYQEMAALSDLNISTEGAVAPAFATILRHCAGQFDLQLVEQYPINRDGKRPIRTDGTLLDQFELRHGVWEAKDIKDNLAKEIKQKFKQGYPDDNILFQTPQRLVLWQDGREVFNEDITLNPNLLIDGLTLFFGYNPPAYEQWFDAVLAFKDKVKEHGDALLKIIEQELKTNQAFIQAFEGFTQLCQEAINPNLSLNAMQEMLIQHLLTERIFRKVFDNPDFVERNIIAREIEKVITALTSRSFSRHEFLKKLDRFYGAIETTAATIDDYTHKQDFLNAIYEKFFQGFAVKVADTHGIVYTPQPIVNFMVQSVEDILQKEFNSSLSQPGVQILDPFVGTGNFIIRVMRAISKFSLKKKYLNELHCNEVMLLPYYIASMNIEHAYYEITGQYEPFTGICLVDTFQLAEVRQQDFFTTENTARVRQQKQAPIFVVIGNPPYNVGQVNENDNNKNRSYKVVDKWVRDTYAKDSKATNKNALADPYVKAISWASRRIGDEGIVALVTNNGFLDSIAFDGMRKQLAQDFSKIYILDLKGNVRKDSMRDGIPIGEKHTVFGLAAMVGISVTFFVKKRTQENTQIFYSSVDWKATRLEKFALIEKASVFSKLDSQTIQPDKKHTWLTEGLHSEFDDFMPLGTKKTKAAKTEVEGVVFKTYSRGAETTRDAWVYSFDQNTLVENVNRLIEIYNMEIDRWHNRTNKNVNLDDFVLSDETKIKWSSRLKECLLRGQKATYENGKIRHSLYRPFCSQFLFFDEILTHRQGQFPVIFPTKKTETENQVICVSGVGSSKPFHALAVNLIPCLDFLEKTQCFPFYTYNENGTNRKENITDWALNHYQTHYQDNKITKWDIFHYVYGLLHHPGYREKYAANLKRELPRLLLAPNFWEFATAGKKLVDLHLNYEQQSEYPLKLMDKADMPLDWRVEKMKLSRDKQQIIYNDSLTIGGIPPETFEYKLGNRSALDWIIDQYRVKVDKRSGIVNDPNQLDDEEYIVRLIGRVVFVSLKTAGVLKKLGDFVL